MKIAIMMRVIDQATGLGVYTERLVEAMLAAENRHEYVLIYRTPAWLGRFADSHRVQEVLTGPRHKILWDQIGVPYQAWKAGADVVFNPKFSVPLLSPIPVTMGLQEPAWWVFPKEHPRWDVLYMRTFLPLYCRKAAHIFPMSRFILEENREHVGLALENATVAYTAPNRHFGPVSDRESLDAFRTHLGLPERFILGVTRVENIGNKGTTFTGTKNVETTVRAYGLCRDRIPHGLVIAGRNVEAYLRAVGFSAGELEGIRFLDFVAHEDMPKLLSLAGLLVMPSLYEGCPATLMEAMKCGCPVVASSIGACREVGGGAPLYANPRDPTDFAEKIVRVLGDERLRAEMRSRGIERAGEFDWDRTARIVLDALSKVVEGPSPSGERVPA